MTVTTIVVHDGSVTNEGTGNPLDMTRAWDSFNEANPMFDEIVNNLGDVQMSFAKWLLTADERNNDPLWVRQMEEQLAPPPMPALLAAPLDENIDPVTSDFDQFIEDYDAGWQPSRLRRLWNWLRRNHA